VTETWARPLGVPFADALTVRRISDDCARTFYQQHHSYMPYLNRVTIHNHGAVLNGDLVGAITYAMPRRSASVDGVDYRNTVEVARVAVGLDMRNLASCFMAASQDTFVQNWCGERGVELLLTFVHADYEGSMFAALRGKGWKNLREAESRPSGNRQNHGIETDEKELWACSIESTPEVSARDGARRDLGEIGSEQASLSDYEIEQS